VLLPDARRVIARRPRWRVA